MKVEKLLSHVKPNKRLVIRRSDGTELYIGKRCDIHFPYYCKRSVIIIDCVNDVLQIYVVEGKRKK